MHSSLHVMLAWLLVAHLLVASTVLAAPSPVFADDALDRRAIKPAKVTKKVVVPVRKPTSTTVKKVVPPKTTAKVTTTAAAAAAVAAKASATITVAPANKIRGVNLGGWFIIEQWMKPSLFAAATTATGKSGLVDQWTFMSAFSNKQQALGMLQAHWSSWITDADFAQIKSLGLNTVRIPVPHWAFSASPDEPYLALAEQPYIGNAIKMAAKYGLSVLLDLHTAPNSQNGYDNSGKYGNVGFRTNNGGVNAQRVLTALQTMVKLYVNDPQYKGAVKSIEVLNEPICASLGADYMTQIYQNAYTTIRSAIAPNALVKPTIVLHDCFISPLSNWAPAVGSGGGLSTMSFTLDAHRYQVFAPYAGLKMAQQVAAVKSFGQEVAAATTQLKRPILTGEFSLAISCTDCVPAGSTSTQIATLNRRWFETQAVAFEQGAGWIFWSWRAENNLPWSFKDAIAANWIPKVITTRDEVF